jgi:hypothetical protein
MIIIKRKIWGILAFLIGPGEPDLFDKKKSIHEFHEFSLINNK